MRKTLMMIPMLALAACGSQYNGDSLRGARYWQQPHPATAEVLTDTHVVRFEPGMNYLPPDQRNLLAQFIGTPGADAVHRVDITTSPQFGRDRRRIVAHNLRGLGVTRGAIRFTEPDASLSPFEARLDITYSVAVLPPHCPDWTTSSHANYTNELHSNFGCSQAANLGLMVADPQDLNGSNGHEKPDGDRNANVIGHYRAGYDWSSFKRSYEKSGGGDAGSSASQSAVTSGNLAPATTGATGQ